MDRPKLYLVSRSDSARPTQGRTEPEKAPVVRKLHPAHGRTTTAPPSPDRPNARFQTSPKAIWDDESSWDSI